VRPPNMASMCCCACQLGQSAPNRRLAAAGIEAGTITSATVQLATSGASRNAPTGVWDSVKSNPWTLIHVLACRQRVDPLSGELYLRRCSGSPLRRSLSTQCWRPQELLRLLWTMAKASKRTNVSGARTAHAFLEMRILFTVVKWGPAFLFCVSNRTTVSYSVSGVHDPPCASAATRSPNFLFCMSNRTTVSYLASGIHDPPRAGAATWSPPLPSRPEAHPFETGLQARLVAAAVTSLPAELREGVVRLSVFPATFDEAAAAQALGCLGQLQNRGCPPTHTRARAHTHTTRHAHHHLLHEKGRVHADRQRSTAWNRDRLLADTMPLRCGATNEHR
jgi:hypothetical protein